MANGVSIDLIVDPKKAISGIGQVESKASGASDKLGRLGKIAGGAILGVAAAGAIGAAALGKAVVGAYSDYQQLSGGVEKLFGNASSSVEKFAAEAANSAGLSTNQYLDTVTSFSASLITGLHGDQEAAAKTANLAIVDMSDNANVFGTNIDSIQQAYQGFAKGNFTMLDNLKLGFGGSQQGMADLINTSGVLGKSMKVTALTVKNVPFDKMIEAIHKVQSNMGITGDTAKEAATTIAGSFAATKSSLQNLVTGLGSANTDFTKLVGNFAKNAQNLINNVAPVLDHLADAIPLVAPVLVSAIQKLVPAILPLASGLIAGLLSGIVKAAPGLVKGAIPVIVSFVNGLIGLLPAMVDSGTKMIVSLVTGIAKALPHLIAVASGTIEDLVDALVVDLPKIIQAGIVLITALVTGLVSVLPTLIPTVVAGVLGLIPALLGLLPVLLTAGLQLLLGLVKGIVAAIPQLIAALPKIIISIVTFLVNAIPTLINAGIQLFLALVGALPKIITSIVNAIPKIIVGIVSAVILAIPKIITAGVKLLVALIENLPAIISGIIKAVPQIIVGLVKAFSNPKTQAQMAQAGIDLIKGLWDGISSLGKWLWGKISGYFGGLVDQVKDLLGIHSPSTVMSGIGGNLIQGLVGGIKGASGLVTSTMSALSRQVTDHFSESLNVQARATFTAAYPTSGGGQAQPTTSRTIAPVINFINPREENVRQSAEKAGQLIVSMAAMA